jgi:hypothetical protein
MTQSGDEIKGENCWQKDFDLANYIKNAERDFTRAIELRATASNYSKA